MGGRTRGGRPKSPPPVLEERVKSALSRAGRPLSFTELRYRSGVRIGPGLSAALYSALANPAERGRDPRLRGDHVGIPAEAPAGDALRAGAASMTADPRAIAGPVA
jgi:hypothetical protein